MKYKLVLLIFLTVEISFAQSSGKSGLAFMKLGFDARNSAMGDFGTLAENDVPAANYNPALLTLMSSPQLMVTHNSWIQDVSNQNFSAGFRLFDIPLMVSLNNTSISDIPVRLRPGEPETTFNANYFFGGISAAVDIYRGVSVGAGIKYIYENLFSDDASGLGFDFGVVYRNVIDGLNIGASFRNIGSMNQLRAESTELPSDLRIGASYSFKAEEIKSALLFSGGFQKYTKTDDNHFHAGAEILYNNLIALRTGYMSGYDSKNITAGAGIIWNSFNFDYAFIPFKYSIGTSHIISVKFNF